ncbi:hypothetical protein [Filimonas effusa]|uniref:Uncharacterized protein n=1 Tax=Filimonas effusa TaxID=2508721 RepID=A0A4Q1D5E8_9BACT|nr:hypothetical protein [Filimonas effusa]RXK83715.1 hypothetical protein ESB13_16680 [Filimonas effusa]
MQRNQTNLLLHPLFLSCLLLLILNDHWWKQAFPGFITGKLSDFAGILMAGVLWRQFFPQRVVTGCIVLIMGFLYWKSPLSQPLIDWCNNVIRIPVARVVDYTDLTALIMLAPAFKIKEYGWEKGSWLKVPVYCLTIFAMPASSMHYFYASPEYMPFYDSFTTKQTREVLLQHLNNAGLTYRIDSVEFIPIRQNYYYLQDSGSGEITAVDSMKHVRLVQITHRGAYYSIPSIVLAQDTVRNIHFQIIDRGKKREIYLMSIKPPVRFPQEFKGRNKVLKEYRKAFKAIITGMPD